MIEEKASETRMITYEIDVDEALGRPPRNGASPGGEGAASRKRRANEFMRDGLTQLDPEQPIPFFCECGRLRCYQAVWLSGDEFDAVREDGRRRRALIADHEKGARRRSAA
jgi:hypothetical protein